MNHGLMSEIDPTNDQSWRDLLFLTIDQEWAADASLAFLLDTILRKGGKATIYCTHDSPLIRELREDERVELGLHPNFNFLLNGDRKYGNSIDEVVEYFKQIVPQATSVRSHCLVGGTQFTESFLAHGLTLESNQVCPAESGVVNKPWRSFVAGVTHAPIFWEDDVHCMYGWEFDVSRYLNMDGLKVFNFHPVPVVLNVRSLDLYHSCKSFYKDHSLLLKSRHVGVGVHSFLQELISATT